MKRIALIVLLLASLFVAANVAVVEPAQAVNPIESVIDPGGGGNSYCWHGIAGVYAYFLDWQARMVGWFQCVYVGPFVWPPLKYKNGYGYTASYCTLGEPRVLDHGTYYWASAGGYC